METLHITLFGHVHVTHPNASAPLKLSPSAQSLLAYLILHQHLVSRDVLMDVFWLDSPSERARANLATALWRLRQLLEPNDVRQGTYLITRNNGEVGFNWESGHWVDTRSFEQPIRLLLRKPVSELGDDDAKQIEGILTLYRGDLLEGNYEDWALRERERFRTLHLNGLTRLMEFHAGRGNFDHSIAYGHEILRRVPVHEEIHRELMRVYVESGQCALAVRQYAHCREMLDRELGVPPLVETQRLYDQIVALPRPDAATGGQTLSQEIAQLTAELQRVQQSLEEATRALKQIAQAVSQLAVSDEDGPAVPGKQK